MSILSMRVRDAKLFKREIETSEANEARRNRAVKGNNSGGGYIVPATIASHYPVGYDPMGVLTGRRLCDTADNKCREIASNFFVLLLLDYLAIYNAIDRSFYPLVTLPWKDNFLYRFLPWNIWKKIFMLSKSIMKIYYIFDVAFLHRKNK